MTTEQCSVDSLLPKNRTETFARQLQNRLRTLSAESDRDGLEDTSWNGDQLSSSSENDIYYDLDSLPGSPVEQSTETDFSEFINVKNSDNIYPGSSGASYLNHSELSINENDTVDSCYLGKIYRSDNLNKCNNVNLDSPSVNLKESEEQCATCDQCSTSQNFNTVSLPGLNDKNNIEKKCSSSYKENGFLDLNRLEKEQLNFTNNKNEPSNEDNAFNNIKLKTPHANSHVKDTFESVVVETLPNNLIDKNQILLKGLTKRENSEEYENRVNSKDCYICDKFGNGEVTDVNRNSSHNNSNVCINNPDSTIQSSEMTLLSSSSSTSQEEQHTSFKNEEVDLENKIDIRSKNEGDSSSEKNKNMSSEYTEYDLCRLVDAVFSKSPDEEQYNSSIGIAKISSRDNRDGVDEEEETIESKRSKFRRSSSLKTGKTPPGTPGCKKIVRFADVLGLDLADVRTFLDEVPKVPRSAFVDLKNVELSSSPPVFGSPLDYLGQVPSLNTKPQRTIVALFQQPSSRPEFLYRVRDNFVCLENAIVSDPILSVITGIVRVKNIDFHKSVHIRYSIDNWKSFADLQAKYVQNSCDGFSDKFSFMLYAHMLNIGQRLEFAVRYHAKGSLFWDNNLGANYIFQCVQDPPSKFLPSSYVPLSPSGTWAAFY